MPDRVHIVYYITAHGYGHGVRSCEILTALRAAVPHAELTVVTALPSDFVASRLESPYDHRIRSFDVGMVQLDSIRIDLEATARALGALCAGWDERVDAEARWLERDCGRRRSRGKRCRQVGRLSPRKRSCDTSDELSPDRTRPCGARGCVPRQRSRILRRIRR